MFSRLGLRWLEATTKKEREKESEHRGREKGRHDGGGGGAGLVVGVLVGLGVGGGGGGGEEAHLCRAGASAGARDSPARRGDLAAEGAGPGARPGQEAQAATARRIRIRVSGGGGGGLRGGGVGQPVHGGVGAFSLSLLNRVAFCFRIRAFVNSRIRRLYFTRVRLGNPAKEFFVQIDTGSDILWVTCAPCQGCPTSSGLDVSLCFSSLSFSPLLSS